MKFKSYKNVTSILVNVNRRAAGRSIIEGREVSWDSGLILTVLELGSKVTTKYKVDENSEEKLEKLFSNALFGSWWNLVIDFQTGKVIDAAPVSEK